MNTKKTADLILHNGHITTLDPKYPDAKNVAIKDGRIVGVDDAESYERGPNTKTIDLKGRRVVPGLNDSHRVVIILRQMLDEVTLRTCQFFMGDGAKHTKRRYQCPGRVLHGSHTIG